MMTEKEKQIALNTKEKFLEYLKFWEMYIPESNEIRKLKGEK